MTCLNAPFVLLASIAFLVALLEAVWQDTYAHRVQFLQILFPTVGIGLSARAVVTHCVPVDIIVPQGQRHLFPARMAISFLLQVAPTKLAANFALLGLNAKLVLSTRPLVHPANTVPLASFRNLVVQARIRKLLVNRIHRAQLALLVTGASHLVFHL